jgi:hypothetical protein
MKKNLKAILTISLAIFYFVISANISLAEIIEDKKEQILSAESLAVLKESAVIDNLNDNFIAKADNSVLNKNSRLTLNKIDNSRFMKIALLQGLNKVTAKTSILTAKISDPIRFGKLLILVHKCWQAPINQQPDSKILLEIFELKNGPDNREVKDRIFYGWIIASEPAVSGLEHPIYDITAISCKN